MPLFQQCCCCVTLQTGGVMMGVMTLALSLFSIVPMSISLTNRMYLSRVIALTHEHCRSARERDHPPDYNPLLAMVTDTAAGSSYSKEISEAMAMVDATERGIKLAFGRPSSKLGRPAHCYVLGDGKLPLCAALMCLSCGEDWTYTSIDPIAIANILLLPVLLRLAWPPDSCRWAFLRLWLNGALAA